jgi:acetoacetyl-CoA synthetase
MVLVPEGITTLQAWADFSESGGAGAPTYERMGFNEPIWILFSSGTTGVSPQ